jgi:PhnB protein
LVRGCDPSGALTLVTRSGPVDLSSGLWKDILVELTEFARRPRESRHSEPSNGGALKMALTGQVKPIPDGYHSVTPYLIVDGAAGAIEFYKRAFGATELLRIGGAGGRIGHAEVRIGDSPVMLADEHPEMQSKGPRSFGGSPVSIVLYVENVDAFVEKAVAAGAKLTRPVEDKFYGDRGGSIEDPYGHIWHVMTHVEDVPPEEMQKRAAALGAKG